MLQAKMYPIELAPRAAAEVQKEVQCQQFRELLKEKEREIEELAAAAEGRSHVGGGDHGWGEDVNLEVASGEVDLDRVAELEAALSARGSNYSLMRSHHMTHKTNEERLVREATYFEFTAWSSFQCGKDFYKESTG